MLASAVRGSCRAAGAAPTKLATAPDCLGIISNGRFQAVLLVVCQIAQAHLFGGAGLRRTASDGLLSRLACFPGGPEDPDEPLRSLAGAGREIGAASQARIEAVCAREGCDSLEARRHLVREALSTQAAVGPWNDRWLCHPCPTAFEPEKEVCRLTRRSDAEVEADNEVLVNGYAFASLHAVDRFFLKVRYALNPLDRARVSGRRHGRRALERTQTPHDDKWDVYHLYNPAHVQELLDLQRVWHNWGQPGKDGMTPAMRLGVSKRPMALTELARGRRRRPIPCPPRTGRPGRRMAGPAGAGRSSRSRRAARHDQQTTHPGTPR